MSRYKAIFDSKGKAYEYQDGTLVWVRDDLQAREENSGSPAVLGDIPDFVSPIDGTVVRGRRGMRDHCARHNVVPTAELAGLPVRTLQDPLKRTDADREATKRTIAEIINSRTYR